MTDTEQGWNKSMPIHTRSLAEAFVDDLTGRGFDTRGPERADGKPDTGKRDCKCGFIVKYRLMGMNGGA